MKNDEYETAKQNYYRPESAGKIISSQKIFNFNFEDLSLNNRINEDKKMKTINEEKIVEKLLKKKNSNNLKKKLNKEIKKENNSSITDLDSNIMNSEVDKAKDNDKYVFNSSIPEYIQGTPIYNNQLNQEKNKVKEVNDYEHLENKKERKLSYEGPENNKFSNIDYAI